MAHVRLSRDEWETRAGSLLLDDLHGATALLLDDVRPADAERLAWWSRAPCIVVASGPQRCSVGDAWADDEATASTIIEGAEQNPDASRVLVDVLRTTPSLSVDRALVVESTAYSLLLASPEFQAWLAASDHPAPDKSGSPLRLERHGDELHITLTQPATRNAFTAQLRDGLCEALHTALADPSIEQVVVTGEGPAFCSGGHLGEFGRTADVVAGHRIRTLRSVGAAVARLGERCRFVIHGPCVGAGVELPAFAHQVVARPDTTFRLPEIAMGLIPGAGGTVSLPRRVGAQRTAELAMTGRTIDATEALALGLVDAVSEA